MFLVSVLQKYDFLTGSDIVTRSEMYGGEYLKDAFHKDFLWVEQLCGFIQKYEKQYQKHKQKKQIVC